MAAEQGADQASAEQGRQQAANQRAMRGQPGNRRPGAATQPAPNTRMVLVEEGAILKLDPADRAALYRLPPHLREPLLQAMQAQGPEGYQPLIDAYYRELSKEVK